MDLLKALKCTELMSERDIIIDMRQKAIEGEKLGWSVLVHENKMPIPTAVKSIFREAIERALDYYNSEIQKL